MLRTKQDYLRLLVAVLMAMLVGQNASAYVITVFDNSAYSPDEATMNATLGITGFEVENFEDTALLPGLSESHGATAIFEPSFDSPLNAWDGTRVFSLRPTDLTFTYAPGTRSFGIGISNDELIDDVILSFQINGTGSFIDLGSFANYQLTSGSINLRNGYLRIDAEPGDADISSVRFLDNAEFEVISFDHLAVKTIAEVPVPSTIALLTIGLLARIRHRHHGCGLVAGNANRSRTH